MWRICGHPLIVPYEQDGLDIEARAKMNGSVIDVV